MTTMKLTNRLSKLNLFGPIFGKELRTASRRKRNYALRMVYVLILTAVVMLAWYSMSMVSRFNPIFDMARMSQIGLELLTAIGVFQFIALQIISPVLTSTAISDEINHSTLGALMMTPITSLQIVTGKLFSKLLTMILLVCASLPLLAIIRVFGGIEWGMVLNLVALTLCASIFSASVSLAYSIYHKRAYASIIMTYVTLLTIYLLIPLMLSVCCEDTIQNKEYFFLYFNPFVSLGWIIDHAHNPSPMKLGEWIYPPVQCALLLGATALMVLISAAFVRRVALRMAAGEAIVQVRRKKTQSTPNGTSDESAEGDIREKNTVRPVSDRPILWRELHQTLMGTKRRQTIVLVFVGIAILFTYSHTWRGIDWEETHMLYTFTFMLFTLIGAAILSATTISSEREAATWEALLTTPLTVREIVQGKIMGVLKRLFPLAALYFGHIVFFTLLGKIYALGVLYMFLLLVGPVIFLVGSGTFITSRFKHTTTAVMTNLGVGLFTWAILPVIAGMMGVAMRKGDDWFEAVLAVNPLVLNVTCFERLADSAWARYSWADLRMDMPNNPGMPIGEFTGFLVLVTLVYLLIGVLLTEWAIRRLVQERK